MNMTFLVIQGTWNVEFIKSFKQALNMFKIATEKGEAMIIYIYEDDKIYKIMDNKAIIL